MLIHPKRFNIAKFIIEDEEIRFSIMATELVNHIRRYTGDTEAATINALSCTSISAVSLIQRGFSLNLVARYCTIKKLQVSSNLGNWFANILPAIKLKIEYHPTSGQLHLAF